MFIKKAALNSPPFLLSLNLTMIRRGSTAAAANKEIKAVIILPVS